MSEMVISILIYLLFSAVCITATMLLIFGGMLLERGINSQPDNWLVKKVLRALGVLTCGLILQIAVIVAAFMG